MLRAIESGRYSTGLFIVDSVLNDRLENDLSYSLRAKAVDLPALSRSLVAKSVM